LVLILNLCEVDEDSARSHPPETAGTLAVRFRFARSGKATILKKEKNNRVTTFHLVQKEICILEFNTQSDLTYAIIQDKFRVGGEKHSDLWAIFIKPEVKERTTYK
jgi:hypothetical protein